jgi:hypothetical protein
MRAGQATTVGVVLEQHGELVAAEAGHRVARAGDQLEALRDLDEQLVTGRVAERVVDGLEVVEVAEQHRQRTRVPTVQGQRVLEPLTEQRPVRQPGELVVEGPSAQVLLPQGDLGQQPSMIHYDHQLPQHQCDGSGDHPELRDVTVPGEDHPGGARQDDRVRDAHVRRRQPAGDRELPHLRRARSPRGLSG